MGYRALNWRAQKSHSLISLALLARGFELADH